MFNSVKSLVCAPQLAGLVLWPAVGMGQAADWQSPVWSEPQVRSLIADMTLNSGKTDLCRKYAAEERDPDSRGAIRRTERGYRITNLEKFERKKVDDKTLIAHKGSDQRCFGL